MSLNELEAVLKAGTWTNSGSTPTIGAFKGKKTRGKRGVMIYKKKDNPLSTLMDGTLLIDHQEGYIHGYDKRTKAARENLLKDVVAILEASDEPIEFVKIDRYDGKIDRMHSFRIEIKRIKEFN